MNNTDDLNKRIGEELYNNKDKIKKLVIRNKMEDLIKIFDLNDEDKKMLKDPKEMLRVYLKIKLRKEQDIERGEYLLYFEVDKDGVIYETERYDAEITVSFPLKKVPSGRKRS